MAFPEVLSRSGWTVSLRNPSRSVAPILASSRCALAIVLVVVCATDARAQCSPAWMQAIGTPGMNDTVFALAALPTGDVIAAGWFTNAAGIAAANIASNHPVVGGGGVWTPLGSGTNGRVRSLAILAGGDVLVGGDFVIADGSAASRIARYNPIAKSWSALGSGTNGSVYAIAVLPSGGVIVGGSFTTAGGVVGRNNIARYEPGTGLWSNMGTGTDDIVRALAVLPDGDVLAGGDFTSAGGLTVNRIARYNPTSASWSSVGSGIGSGNVQALAVLPGGDVIVGGGFGIAGGANANNIARCSPSASGGGAWAAMGSGVNSFVHALAVLPSGELLVGGNFNNAGGVAANFVAIHNAAPGPGGLWSALGLGTNQRVWSFAVLAGGDAIVGGNFTAAGAIPANYIARYTFGAPAPTIATQPSNTSACRAGSAMFTLVAAGGGPFTYQWRKGLVAINTIANPSAATPTLTLANVQSSSSGSYNCIVTGACASITSDAATLAICAADFNCDTFLDFTDFDDFVTAFALGNPLADFNGDGFLDFTDFDDFVGAFEAGC